MNVYDNFLRKTNRLFNPSCGRQLDISDFQKFHYLYAHKFDGEISDSGWIGATIKLEKEFGANYTLGDSSDNILAVIFNYFRYIFIFRNFHFYFSYLDMSRRESNARSISKN